jgi:Uracil-DNA glycosylase
MAPDLESLNHEIISCSRCKRLVEFRNNVLKNTKKYEGETFWRKAITGFGDIDGQLLLVGLAPAASGANRTGRVFTGDRSSEFLMKCLYRAGITNQDTSVSREDGLSYRNTYISLAVRCVPPENKPERTEIESCSSFLISEIKMMKNLEVIVAMGKIAFDSVAMALSKMDHDVKRWKFSNGCIFSSGSITLMGVFHPSPRNVNTGRINEDSFVEILETALEKVKIS